MSLLNKIKTYVKVSPVQQASIALNLPLALLFSTEAYNCFSRGQTGLGIAAASVAGINGLSYLLNQYLAVDKYKKYKKLKHAFKKHGWDERLLQPLSDEWCNRNLSHVAAQEMGFKKETEQYFSERGYVRHPTVKDAF